VENENKSISSKPNALVLFNPALLELLVDGTQTRDICDILRALQVSNWNP
jgi:hypothetical protein